MITCIFSRQEFHYLLDKYGIEPSQRLGVDFLREKVSWDEGEVVASLIRGGTLVSHGEGYRLNRGLLPLFRYIENPESLISLSEVSRDEKKASIFLALDHTWVQLIITGDVIAFYQPLDEELVLQGVTAGLPETDRSYRSFELGLDEYLVLSLLMEQQRNEGNLDLRKLNDVKQLPVFEQFARLHFTDTKPDMKKGLIALIKKGILNNNGDSLEGTDEFQAIYETVTGGTLLALSRIDFEIEKKNTREVLFYYSPQRIFQFQRTAKGVVIRETDREFARMLISSTILSSDTLARNYGAVIGQDVESNRPAIKAPRSVSERQPVHPKQDEVAASPAPQEKTETEPETRPPAEKPAGNMSNKKKMPGMVKFFLVLGIIAAAILAPYFTIGPRVAARYILSDEKDRPEQIKELSQEIKKNARQFAYAMARYRVTTDDIYEAVSQTGYGDFVSMTEEINTTGYRNRRKLAEIMISRTDPKTYNSRGMVTGLMYNVPPGEIKKMVDFVEKNRGPKLYFVFPYAKRLILEALDYEKERRGGK